MAQGSGFSGRRCFITGAASGIGRATALKLAADGAELYLTDRDAEGLQIAVADARALGAQVPEHRALDISDFDEVAAFAAIDASEAPAMITATGRLTRSAASAGRRALWPSAQRYSIVRF